MNYFCVHGALIAGIQAVEVKIECVQSRRLPFLQVIGGSGAAISELRERVIAALGTLQESKFRLPARRITVEIRPGVQNLPLEQLDLPVAVAILGSCGHIPSQSAQALLFCGGLGLDGTLRSAGNEAALRQILAKQSFTSGILPLDGSEVLQEAQWGSGGGFQTLEEVVRFLRGDRSVLRKATRLVSESLPPPPSQVWNRIEGQEVAKRMIEVAAAGGHHILLPSPAAAKPELLAHALSSLLPPLSDPDFEEVRTIYSLAGIEADLTPNRPFFIFGSCRSLPPILSDRRLGKIEEILLAHHGVLFVDKICEREPDLFPELLDPMVRGRLPARMGRRRVDILANPILFATSPLCLCGGRGVGRVGACTCRPTSAKRYEERWKSLLRHPFDLCLKISTENTSVSVRSRKSVDAESWGEVCSRVWQAQARRDERQTKWNGRLGEEEVFTVFPWKESVRRLWKVWELRASPEERVRFSSIARVALTLCDLRAGNQVEECDLLEAHHYFPTLEAPETGRRAANSGSEDIEANSTAIP